MKKFTGKLSMTILSENACIIASDNEESKKYIASKFNYCVAPSGQMTEAQRKQLGIFDSDFNPDVKKGQLKPLPEDYMLFPFRLISATIVGSGSWKSTDFSNVNVLKESLPLISFIPAFKDHNLQIDKSIGTIGQCEWVEASNGVPAGIDGPYVIDMKLQPELCRKLMAPVPEIQSSSVTVVFDWESSHEFENEYDFYYHVGEMLDGREVTRVVTKIHEYIESSLVYAGADCYAKKKNEDGTYVNIPLNREVISNSKKFEDKDEFVQLFKTNNRLYEVVNYSKENIAALKSNYTHKIDEDMQIKIALSKVLNVKPEEVTEEMISQFTMVKTEEFNKEKENFSKLNQTIESLNAKVTEKETEVTSLTKNVNDLKAEIESNKQFVQLGNDYISLLRKEAVDAYTKSVLNKTDQVILDRINSTTDVKSLESDIKLFNGKLITEFSGHCVKCGSKDISFRSSANTKDDSNLGEQSTHLSELL